MIIDWFKNKIVDYPLFYLKYLDFFKENTPFNQFVVFNFELQISSNKNHQIIRIFAYKVNNQEILLNDFIDLKIENNDTIETQAINDFTNYIKNLPLVSYQINEKIVILNQYLKKLNAGKIKNEVFDLELLFKTHHNIVDDETISLQKIYQDLKIKSDNIYDLNEKVYFEALTFIKINKK
ncbi:MAG: hypothetical protein ACOVQ2_05645 [Flavobacterium sp.]